MMFPEIKHIALSWIALFKSSLTREMEFRGNFVLGIIRQLLWLAAFIFVIEIIFRNTSTLAGWEKPEVLIVLALSRFIEGTADFLFTGNLAMLPAAVQKGEFDYYLTKPLPAQFFSAFRNVNVYIVGNITAGLILLIYGTAHLTLPVSISHILLLLLTIACGLLTLYGLLVLTASLVFKLERLEALWGFMNLFTEPLTVPFDVFPTRLRIALTYFLPLAFIVFVPAQAITGRITWAYAPVVIGVTTLLLILANLAWRAGIKRYTSASS